MLQAIISRYATCTIFWAPDFRNWRESISQAYPESIDGISNYSIFLSSSNRPFEGSIFQLYDFKYVINLLAKFMEKLMSVL